MWQIFCLKSIYNPSTWTRTAQMRLLFASLFFFAAPPRRIDRAENYEWGRLGWRQVMSVTGSERPIHKKKHTRSSAQPHRPHSKKQQLALSLKANGKAIAPKPACREKKTLVCKEATSQAEHGILFFSMAQKTYSRKMANISTQALVCVYL